MSVESLEDRLLLAGAGPQLISIFPNAGVTQPEDTGGRLQQNEVLETAPRELVFRFNPGQSIEPNSLRSGIQVFRSEFDNDFNNGSIPVEIGSIQIGDQPNEVILRFASTLPDDQYHILLRGSGSSPLRNTMNMPFNNGMDLSFFFEVDRGAQIEAVVHEPVVRSQILTVTNIVNLSDGVTFTVQAGGKPITFEFDNDGVSNADNDNVFAVNTAGATTTTQYATQIGLALLNAAAVHGSAFGIEAVQGSLPNAIVISANGDTAFSPAISVPKNDLENPVTGITIADGEIAQRENFINIHFNANDPLNAVSRGTLVVPNAADDGTLIINDGNPVTVNTPGGPLTLTMDSGPAARFNVNFSSDAVVRDGDFVVIDSQRYEFNTGPVLQVTATGLMEMTIGGTFTLTDNAVPANTLTFEFTNGGPATVAGAIAIDLAGATGRADIVDRIVSAINAQQANGSLISASALGNSSGRITLTNDTALTVAVQNGIGSLGGYGVTAGSTGILVEETFTSAQLAKALSDAVNGAANRGFSGNLVNFPTRISLSSFSFSNPSVFTNLNLTGSSSPTTIDYYFGDSAASISQSIADAIPGAIARSGVVAGGWVVQLPSGSFSVPSGSPFTAYSAENPSTVESPAFYQAIYTDGTLRLPDQVIYNADAGIATLRFNSPLDAGTYTLRIGESFEATNTLSTTVNLGTRFGDSPIVINDFIGGDPTTGTLNPNDIDLYQFNVLTGGGVSVQLETSHGLNGFIRLFDATTGAELASGMNSLAAAIPAGTYLVGISSQGNSGYNALNGTNATGGTSTGSYRLTITPSVANIPDSDDNSSFETPGHQATNLGTLGTSGQVVTALIQPQSIDLPPEPGSNDEPGHRDIPISGDVPSNGENHLDNLDLFNVFGHFLGSNRGTDAYAPEQIPTIAYTFQSYYGTDPQGNPLFNAISAEQRQRAREIFELYSLIAGVQFVEAATVREANDMGLEAITVVTGDMRAVSPSGVAAGAPGGLRGISGFTNTPINPNNPVETVGFIAIMDAGENFTPQDNLYGQLWFLVAMQEIGQLLGLDHAFDLNAIMSDVINFRDNLEPVFPGDHDIAHMRRLYRRDSIDIDMYKFDVAEAGLVTIETIAERLSVPKDASQLNTVLRLYRQEPDGSKTLIAQNDDYYGNDSLISLRLTEGTYFVGVSSLGNENYDPSVANSGAEGITDGEYELRLDLLPDLQPIPDDPDAVSSQDVSAKGRSVIRDVDDSLQFDDGDRKATALDGDADGRAGGVHTFSFQVAGKVMLGLPGSQQEVETTIFVDKSAANYANPSARRGSIENPYVEIDQALIAASALRMELDGMNLPIPVIVRIVGNTGTDGQLGSLGDNKSYEIGINNDPVNPRVLVDGGTLEVPKDINVVIDAGAVFKLQDANLDAGSSAQGIDRSGGSLQILGTTFNDVIFTSWHDDSIGGDSDGVFTLGANPGDWGGVVFRGDSDFDFEYRSTQTKQNIFATNTGGIPNPNNPFLYTFTGFPIPATGASLSFLAFGNFLASGENLRIQFVDSAGDVITGSPDITLFDDMQLDSNTVLEEDGADATTIAASVLLSEDEFNLLAADGSLRIKVTASTAVDNINIIESLRVDLNVGTDQPVFLNTVNHATVLYAGGPVVVDSVSRDFDAIHMIDSRPTVTFNTIALSANAAISGNPNSFNDTFEDPRRYDHHLDRLGPDIHGNAIFSNEINGVRIRTELTNGIPLDKLQVPARLTSTDVVYVITENLVIDGSPGGLIIDPGPDPDITSDDVIVKRTPGRLQIDPGVIVKLAGARIELERGGSNLIAEGTPEDPIVFTSINDDGIGAGGSFDTNNDSLPPRLPDNVIESASMTLLLSGAGGETRAFGEGGLEIGTPLPPDVVAAATLTFHGPDGVGKDGPLAKLGWSLNLLYHDHQAYIAGGRQGEFTPSLPFLHTAGESTIIELSAAAGNVNALRTEIQAEGYQVVAQAGSTIAILIPIDSLDDVVTLQHARVIKPVYVSDRHVGATTSQADVSLNADDARSTFGVNGQGITIGVLSDSFNTSGAGSYASDIATGDLPGPGNPLGNSTAVTVLQELAGGSDEGRAMLQLIHDVAPGADLQFATAFGGEALFAANIRALRDAGSDVIVDDVGYATEPFFQDGLVAQAVDEVVGDGVAYFSAAGNSARESYESAFTNSGVAGPGGAGTLHDFDPGAGVDTFQQITVDPFALARISFQWDEPFGSLGGLAAASDLDLLFFDAAGNLLTGGNVLQGQDLNIGADAFEFAAIINPTGAPLVINVGILHNSGPIPNRIKYVNFGGGFTIDEFQTNSATSFGHPNAAGAQAVGAAFYFETPEFGTSPPLLEPFSSAGGIDILFDTAGNRLTTPEVRQTPGIVAPDGTNTTFFGTDVEGDGFPNFFGTSAAAPHAAAVAALMLEAAGGSLSLTPGQISSLMESTAFNMDVPGFDDDTGFGLLNALGAVTQAQSQGGGEGPDIDPAPDDWSGIVFNAGSSGNFDYVQVRYAGGTSPIAGGFAGFNPVEIIQADVRISNSIFEDNGDGQDLPNTTRIDRIGRGENESATIFVRGAQPTIVSNIFQNNQGDVLSIDANAMQAEIYGDPGRATGPIFTAPLFGTDDPNATTEYANNFGPLVRNNRMADNEFNGMEIRGGELTTETVWDDTDIVHILREEIVVPNLHTYGGLRLQSSGRESLVVKLNGQNAGFTADGTEADIDDRIGGTLEILGTPGRPVVLTSLFDNSVGAGFAPDGTPLLDTVDPTVREAAAGDWRSVRLDQFSNDRNVAVYNERERPTRLDFDVNKVPNVSPNGAEFLGVLAPGIVNTDPDNLIPGPGPFRNLTIEQIGDDNQRAGYEIHGFINTDDPTDEDVYSFTATSGSEVWFDIDRTSGSLDTIIELIDANGNVIFASSDDSQNELKDPDLLEGSALPLRKDERFGGDFYSSNPKDAGMRVILPGADGTTRPEVLGNTSTYFVRVRSKDGLTSGEYQLQIRLRQTDEHPGSTVQFSEIRFATNGIEVFGMPGHSPLVGEAGEPNEPGANINNSVNTATNLGNVLVSDQDSFSASGNLVDLGGTFFADDVDFYRFFVNYDDLSPIAGGSAALTFDVDFADGLARPDSALYIFQEGRDILGNPTFDLIFASSDSNVADDRPAPLQGNDLEDPSRATVGALDPYLTVQLSESPFPYYAVVTSDVNLPEVLTQFEVANAVNQLVRLEPIETLRRVTEDHIRDVGGGTLQDPLTLTQLFDIITPSGRSIPQYLRDFDPFSVNDVNVNREQSPIVPWHLGDVVMIVSQDAGGDQTALKAINPFTGETVYDLGGFSDAVYDIAINRRTRKQLDFGAPRPDEIAAGTIVGLGVEENSRRIDANMGNFLTINLENGANPQVVNRVDDTIQTFVTDPANGNAVRANAGDGFGVTFNAITFNDGTAANDEIESGLLLYAVGQRPGDFDTPTDTLRNILYEFLPSGVAQSDPAINRSGNGLNAGAQTQIVERGVLNTDLDAIPGGSPGALGIPEAASGGSFIINDGDRFTVTFDDGVNPTQTEMFVMDSGPSALFNVDIPSDQVIRDGNFITLDGQRYEFDTGSILQVTANAAVGMTIGATFSLTDTNGNTVTFEFTSGNNPQPGRVPIDLQGASTRNAIVTRIVAGINGQQANGFAIDATPLNNGSGRISLQNDSGTPILSPQAGFATIASPGITPGSNAILVEEFFSESQIAAAVSQSVYGDPLLAADANLVNFPTFNNFGAASFTNPAVFTNLGTTGETGNPRSVNYFAGENGTQVAARIASAINGIFGSGTALPGNGLVQLDPVNNNFFFDTPTDAPPFVIAGNAPGGFITGLATINSQLWAVSDAGGLFRITNPTSPGGASLDYIETATELVGLDFQGLSAGPGFVENGVYHDLLFGITGDGRVYAFDTTGELQPVFWDGLTNIPTGLGNVNGVSFSNLDRNLWHATEDFISQPGAGGGLDLAFTNERDVPNPGQLPSGNTQSFNSLGFLVGGAQGTMETEYFSLQGYSAADAPTLYFSYFLEGDDQRDAFNVYIARPDGEFDMISGNGPNGTGLSATFDNTDTWRQVRIDLSAYAGEPELKLRLEFNTGRAPDVGTINNVGLELRARPGDVLRDGHTFMINAVRDRANSLATENVTFEFDLGHTIVMPPASQILDGDQIEIQGPGGSRTFTFVLGGTTAGTTIGYTLNDTAAQLAARLNGQIQLFGLGINTQLNGQRLNLPEAVAVIENNRILTNGTIIQVSSGFGQVSINDGTSTLPFAGDAQTIFNQIQNAIANLGFNVAAYLENETITVYNSVFVNNVFGTSVATEGRGVNAGNIPVVVHAGMSDFEVADVMRAAIAQNLLVNPISISNIKAFREVIRVIGHDVVDAGPLGLTDTLPAPPNLGPLTGFARRERNVNNDFSGVYIDEFIIGFAERGEAVTSAGNNPQFDRRAPGSTVADGNYQLEIRRGTEVSIGELQALNILPDRVLDTNDRLSSQITITIPNGEDIIDGQTFRLSDGINTFVFEFEDVELLVGDPNFGIASTSDFAVRFRASESAHVIAARLRDLFNSTQVQDVLDITAALADGLITGTGGGNSNEVNVFGVASAAVNGSVDPALFLQPEVFSLNADPNIQSSTTIPHTSIETLGDGSYHYYTFTANEGDVGIFDIDRTGLGFDSELFLFDEDGLLIASNDDAGGDLGSNNVLDPFLQVVFPRTGTYRIGVGEFNSGASNGRVTGNAPDVGDFYTLHVSLTNPGEQLFPDNFNAVGRLKIESYSDTGVENRFLGDSNQPRLQGSIQIAQNFIFDTLGVGILIDDNIRRPGTDQPVVGAPRQLPTTSDERLTRGVKITNNVIAHFGDAGIVLNGDDNSGATGADAAVPFHRIINNTIYGGQTPTGDGVRATNNVAPTLLNNIIANTEVAINADASSAPRTVIARSSYQNNGAIGTAGPGVNSQQLFAGEALFVDPVTNNFYLAAGARPIDSARNQFEDRDSIVQVSASIGIQQSNLFSPLFDAYGQFRTNDENTPNTGEGNPPFFDRGAIEREDVAGPSARLIAPEDNDGLGLDLDPDDTEVFLVNQVIRQFIVGLDDIGIGIDDSSVNPTNLQLTFNGGLLTEGVDYLFRYNTNTKQITLEAASGVFPFGDYRINLVNQNGIRDLAGNNLLANRQPAGTTQFDITIAPPPVVSIQDVTVTEGDDGTTVLANFVISLSGPTQSTVQFNLQTADGTATSSGPDPGDVDYVSTTSTVTFTPGGPLTQVFSVVVNGDAVLEQDESFTVTLTNPVDGSIIQATGTINDDELLLQLTPENQTVLEGDTGTTDMTFTVTLIDKNTGLPAADRNFDVSVGFTTSDGTALAGQDYVDTTGNVTIAGNQNTATFTIPIVGDEIQEVPALEDFFIELVNPVNAGIDPDFGTVPGEVPGQVTGTIRDDDPKFRVDNPVVVEGDSGTRMMKFTVSISSPAVSPVTVSYAVQGETATAGQDFIAIPNGMLTFDPGSDPNADGDNNPLTQQVLVNINPDNLAEGNETFLLVLSNPSAGGIAPGEGTGRGTIIDDDPRITIDDVAVNEGNSGTTVAEFIVNLSVPSPNDVTVNFTTSIGNAVTAPGAGTIFETESNDTLPTAEALSPASFVTLQNANITDSQGVDVSETIPHVTIAGRGDDSFDFFTFTGVAGSRVILDIDGATFDSQLFLFNAAGTVIASNDDGFVNGGPGGNGLDDGSSSTEDAFVEFVLTADGTYTIGVGRNDSVPSASGLTAGPAGTIERGDQYNLHVSVENLVRGQVNEVEPNNSRATAQNVDNGDFNTTPNANINDNTLADVSTSTPHITINGTGDGTFDYYSFTVGAGQRGIFDIDGASFDTELFLFNSAGSLLTANDDLSSVLPGLDAGSTSSLDSFVQFNFIQAGTYVVAVGKFSSDASGGLVTGATPDPGDTYTLNIAIEGHALASGTGGPVVADGSADPISDFSPIGQPDNGTSGNPGTLIIPAGSTTGRIIIELQGDTVNELEENFFVRLSNAIGGVIEDGTGEGTILNDDAPIISISDPIPTPEAGPLGNANVVTFVVTLSRPADFETTIDFTTVNGTAIAGQDFVAVSGSVANETALTFAAGEQVKTISVALIKDGQLNEGTETFTLLLSNPIGANFGDTTGVGTIIDNTGLVERVLAVTAPDAGGPGIVRVFDSLNGSVRFELEPYPGFMGGVRVATGDINNDGTPDIVTAPGPGFEPRVKVFSGVDGSLLTSFLAYSPLFTGGMYVATGDFAEDVFTQGDSFDDIIVGPEAGGGPHVRVFSSAVGSINTRRFEPVDIENRLLFNFFAYVPLFTGGVRVAAGDVTGDGVDDLVTAAGPGGGPHVQIFDGLTRSTQAVRGFFAYDQRFTGGVYIAVADVNINVPSTGRAAEIITSPGFGGGPHIRVWNVAASPTVVAEFFAYAPNFIGGVRVAAGDINGDTSLDIITSPGFGGGPHVRAFDGRTVVGFNQPTDIANFMAYAPNFIGGVFVAGVLEVDFSQPLLAAEVGGSGQNAPALTQEDVDAAVSAAVERLQAAGVSQTDLDEVGHISVTVGDLSGNLLGLATGTGIVLDVDAAGNGWFIDPTPAQDEEFATAGNTLAAVDASAAGRADLLTVVLHELGHKLGLDDIHSHLHPDALMNATLPVGTRRLPESDGLDEAFTDESLFDSLLLD